MTGSKSVNSSDERDTTNAHQIAANDQEPRYSLGSLRDFTKDWTHLGRKTFTISELAAYVGDDDYGMLHEGARVVEDHPDLLKQEGDRG